MFSHHCLYSFTGIARFIVEFFREPDPQLGFIAGPFTMGQLLSASMAAAGVVIYYHEKRAITCLRPFSPIFHPRSSWKDREVQLRSDQRHLSLRVP